MIEQPYETEDVLQTLLAQHPDLLAGDQADGEPRRWLLLAREAGLGDAERDGRWSVDHLFVDQDAIPTIVEVKRSDDTRIRREVVGQMLEYAANAVSFWRTDELRARFEAAPAKDGKQPDELLADLLADEGDADEFWEQFRTNLAASKVRLVFVADEIPPGLRRLVEFLNEQMQSAEVLAVEVKQYVDAAGEHQTLVPRLVGQTERARQAKGTSSAGRWTHERLLGSLAEHSTEAVDTARKIIDWSERRHLRLWYGRGSQTGSVTAGTSAGIGCYPFILYTDGKVEIGFETLLRRPPFDRDETREELRGRLNAIPGVNLPPDGLARRPTFALTALYTQSGLQTFLDAMGWVLDEVAAAESSTPV